MINLEDIAIATGSAYRGPHMVIQRPEPSIDSRTVNNPGSCIFFALKTRHNDGHLFIADLYAKGVRAFVVQADFDTLNFPEAGFILNGDAVEVLQKMALLHRQNFYYPVIGITGSNGKTMVKEWLLQTLDEPEGICASPKSFNSQLGVPLSLMQMNESHHLGIFEAGISTVAEMEKLEKMIRPGIGVLTHMGPAHNEGFESQEQKLEEKLKLFSNSEIVILRRQEEVLNKLKCPVLTFGLNDPLADLNLQSSRQGKTSLIKGSYKDQSIEFHIPFTDEASIENACLCCLVTLYFGQFKPERFARLSALGMRMELKKGRNNTLLINESYSNDLHALASALNFLDSQSVHASSTVILSDIEGSGLSPDVLYNRVRHLLNGKSIKRLIGIGPGISEHQSVFENNLNEVLFYKDTPSFLKVLPQLNFRDENILLKGARSFRFEEITKRLEQTVHGTVLEINLSAASNNLKFFREKLPSEVKIMAMVKAFAYGSGSFEMAKQIENKVDYMAVAYTDEGVALRNAGIKKPIMVMNAEEETFFQLSEYRLEPVVFSVPQLRRLAELHNESSGGLRGDSLKIHIELDSGMHRLGFMPAEIDRLSEALREHKSLEIASVFSHLSAGDEKKHDDFTHQQFRIFIEFAEKLEHSMGVKLIKHISNTAGILRFSQDKLNMVRLGIGLYGIDPTGEFRQNLEPVFTLKTIISQIKSIESNESVGYSRKAISDRKRKIAVLALGYADGLNRLLSNGKGSFLINGKMAPITGNVCMDMCMVDVTDIDCQEGDEAIVFGKDKSIYELADTLNTIPYEVLTAISQRVKRVFISE